MADKPPEIWAAADLEPISPSPVHTSSPVMVPTLQEQADIYSNMTLNNSNPLASLASILVEPSKTDEEAAAPSSEGGEITESTAIDHEDVDSTTLELDKALDGLIDGVDGHSTTISTESVQGQEESQLHTVEPQDSPHQALESSHDAGESSTDDHDVPVGLQLSTEGAPKPESIHTQSKPSSPMPRASQDLLIDDSITFSTSQPYQSQPAVEAVLSDNAPIPSTSNASRDPIDIQALVDNITARAAAADAIRDPANQGVATSVTFPQNMSLPPKPPISQQPPNHPAVLLDDAMSHPPDGPQPSRSMQFPSNTTPKMNTLEPHSSATVVPVPSLSPEYAYHATTTSQHQMNSPSAQKQRWENFLQDERKYVSEAKWDRFPDGSRIFVGNLSSERVSKREVFDVFSPFGRLAQISLKQAYGFVQYHTAAEGQAAMRSLQGIKIKGRQIHLEISRTQKKDGDANNRGAKGKRDNDRNENSISQRDDYRPRRRPSPRRDNHRPQSSYDSHSRGRSHHDGHNSNRRRSRSPFHAGSRDFYRQRSPIPNNTVPNGHYSAGAHLGLPRRYGGDIPDVQFLLLQEVERDFVSWAEKAFTSQGLRVQVMFLNPQFPRDAVLRQFVVEGVHAVAELNYHAQQSGKIPLQVFDRSAGHDNVRYEQYQDLDPPIAAQVVLRTKSQTQPPTPYGNNQYAAPSPYVMPPQGQYPPHAYSQHNHHPSNVPGPGGVPLDPATIQSIASSLNGQRPGVPSYPPRQQHHGHSPLVDVNNLLATLAPHSQPPTRGHPPPQRSIGYAPPPPPPMGYAGSPQGDSAQHVQNIMSQLARYK
ncbi:hypothetical protein GGR57DRAFT_408402 [Xylariaceae sp. FL1272]|nr:hypothetical protein GGR57DRAFT_408402 [Xylariaceae sp. FL1272]